MGNPLDNSPMLGGLNICAFDPTLKARSTVHEQHKRPIALTVGPTYL